MFRKYSLPPNKIIEDIGYETNFLCPCNESCVLDKSKSPACELLLDIDEVKKNVSPCKEGIGNCTICQCPLLEEDGEAPGHYMQISALACGHLYHSNCLRDQQKVALMEEIGMAARVGRKMSGEKVVLSCSICNKKNCLVHAFHVSPNFLYPLDLEMKSKYELELALKMKASKKRPKLLKVCLKSKKKVKS